MRGFVKAANKAKPTRDFIVAARGMQAGGRFLGSRMKVAYDYRCPPANS
jgi:hypothetical protein